MRKRNRTNVLLVEILIVLLFFMLSATVLMQVFASARNMTVLAGIQTRALGEAQNVAEALYASDDMEEALEDMGFMSAHGAWTCDYDEFILYVALDEEHTDSGIMENGNIYAFYSKQKDSSELFNLPLARYRGVEE